MSTHSQVNPARSRQPAKPKMGRPRVSGEVLTVAMTFALLPEHAERLERYRRAMSCGSSSEAMRGILGEWIAAENATGQA